jgi:chromate reductase
MKIVTFGASSSKNSINKKLASYVADLIPDGEIRLLDLNNYEMPIYSIDRELEFGQPKESVKFIHELEWADTIVISFSEHNGAYTAAFKNVFDWASRVKLKMFDGKKLILLSTSGGPRGGQTVLEIAMERFPRHGAEIVGSMAIPTFKENYDEVLGLINLDLKSKLLNIISKLN